MNVEVEQNPVAVADMLKRMIESQRRERPTMDAVPVPGAMMDYAQAGMCVQNAMHHLDEALPTGQKVRAELALALLLMGAAMLSDWMEQKGYKVAWMPDPADALEAATSEVGALDVVIPTGG